MIYFAQKYWFSVGYSLVDHRSTIYSLLLKDNGDLVRLSALLNSFFFFQFGLVFFAIFFFFFQLCLNYFLLLHILGGGSFDMNWV